MPSRLCIFIAVTLLGAANVVHAATIQYNFNAPVSFETRNGMAATPDQRLFVDGDLVSGSFTYDNGLTDGFPAMGGGTFYQALTNLSGMIAGNAFADAQGAVGVNNDGFDSDPGDPNSDLVDFLLLIAETAAPVNQPLSGFQIENAGTIFQLVNVRLFWIESASDFFDDEVLPSELPPGIGVSRLALDFADITNPDNRHIAFAEPLVVTAVPVPAAFWLFISATLLLGWLGGAQRRS